MSDTEHDIPKPPLEEPIENKAPPAEETPDYKDKYLRVLAEAENTRRRLQKEKQDMMRFAIDHVLLDVLAPIDQLESALKYADQMSGEVKNWALGFQMILNQFKEVLTSHGVSSFVSEGEKFDPSKHEAVETEETDTAADGTILKELAKGYRCGDRIIRAARVKVAKKVKE